MSLIINKHLVNYFFVFILLSYNFVAFATIEEDLLARVGSEQRKLSSTIKKFAVEDIVDLSHKIQIRYAKEYGVSIDKIRKLDKDSISKLLQIAENGRNVSIISRHGEQFTSGEKSKVKLMQMPRNMEDSITIESAIEYIGTQLVLLYMMETIDKDFSVSYSENKRAKVPALSLANTLNVNSWHVSALDCINYPDNQNLIDIYVDSSGTLSWNKSKVDGLLGKGVFSNIVSSMAELLEKDGNKLKYMMTHTQQINAVGTIFGKDIVRLKNYGFVVKYNDVIEVFPDGLYSNKHSLQDN